MEYSSEPSTAKELTPLAIVQARLQTRQYLDAFQRKTYNYRRLVAGDLSIFTNEEGAQEAEPGNSSQEFFDFINTSSTNGKSNKLLQTVKTLLTQTTYHFPEVVFENLTPQAAALNSQYCTSRLGDAPYGCNARDHMRMATLDYMIAGTGWVKACLRNNKPVLTSCDILDMVWDRSVRLACDIRWASCRYREPLGNWIEMFGPEPFQTYFNDADEIELDKLVELEWYYDIDSAEGSHYVFDCSNLDEPILAEPNPYFYLENGNKSPYVPYEPFYVIQLPSTKEAQSIVETLIPHQRAMWEAEETMSLTLARSAPFYTVTNGALDAEQRKLLEQGDIGTIVELQSNGTITAQQGIKVDPQIMAWRDQNASELIAQGGANPYAAGAPVAGVSYAAEVNAIQGQSGLAASNIAKDLAAFWQRSVRKFLGVAKLYDDQPITLTIDGVDLRFDEYQPVSRFLRPQANIIVKEATMTFKPEQVRIAEAANKLQVATGVAQMFPNAVKQAFEDYLVAVGIKDTSTWMDQSNNSLPIQLPQNQEPPPESMAA